MSQHMDALAVANRIRLARAGLKRRIATGEVTVAEILQDTPGYMDTMPISALLMAQHRWAVTRARQFLRPLSISELRPIGQLTPRERSVIIERLQYPQWNGWGGRVAA